MSLLRRQVCGSRNSGGNAVRRTATEGICCWGVGFGLGGENSRRVMLWRLVFRGGLENRDGGGEVFRGGIGAGVLNVLCGGVVGEVMNSPKSSSSMSDFWCRWWYFGFGGVGGGGGVRERPFRRKSFLGGVVLGPIPGAAADAKSPKSSSSSSSIPSKSGGGVGVPNAPTLMGLPMLVVDDFLRPSIPLKSPRLDGLSGGGVKRPPRPSLPEKSFPMAANGSILLELGSMPWKLTGRCIWPSLVTWGALGGHGAWGLLTMPRRSSKLVADARCWWTWAAVRTRGTLWSGS